MSDSPTPSAKPSFINARADVAMRFPNQPPGQYSRADFDRLLIWCSENNVSDINLTTDDQIVVKSSGRLIRVTDRIFSQTEVQNLLEGLYRSGSITGELSKGSDKDFAYDLKPDRNSRYRFRVNATAIIVQGQVAINVTLRTISAKPVELKYLDLEPEIFRAMAPHQGMVVITGATGSGKSTLLSSIIRYLVEEEDGNRKVLTYESPIEYVYDELIMPSSMVCQTEVPRNLPTFSSGTRNSLRRAPEIILVGEARDTETVAEAITASMTGHALYTTVHSNDVPSTIPRMISLFHEGERNARAADLISSIRLIVSQRLEKTPAGGRVALREFLVITPEIRDILMGTPLDQLSLVTRKLVDDHGQSFLKDARRKHAQGNLSDDQLRAEELKDAAGRRDLHLAQARLGGGLPTAGMTDTSTDVDPASRELAAPSAPSPSRAPAGVVKVAEPLGGDNRLDSLGGQH